MSATTTHRCYKCAPETLPPGVASLMPLGTIEATRSEAGEEVFFASGYSAREIAQKHAREQGGNIYVNNVSRKIKRPDLTVWIAYAVATSPVYTMCGPDEFHRDVHRVYWKPLGA